MTPVKPFASYKWRWLSVTPSEGLLKAPVFLGVLRVLAENEGKAFSSNEVFRDLSNIQRDLTEVLKSRTRPLSLARSRERNVIRNSGQYWRGTGLITSARGTIGLTGFGKRVADGQVTQAEFAGLIVQEAVLPNPATYSDQEIANWVAAGLSIKPLKLILEVLNWLGRNYGGLSAAFLTNNELMRIMIPLAGMQATASEIARHISLHRQGRLDIADWPDCAPADNDGRLSREFLLFLANFGLLRLDTSPRLVDDQKFFLLELFDVENATAPIAASIFAGDAAAESAVQEVRHSPFPSIIERQRRLANVLTRPGQAKFRSLVMTAAESRCFLSGETIPQVLEAAHIVPAAHGGADEESNGLCLRVDLHRLFDSGNLRLRSDGSLVRSEAVAASPNYGFLPAAVQFPVFVNNANVAWRDSYL